MAICQCMIQDFMYGWKNKLYDKFDLEVGLQYAEDLLSEGITKEPFHHYDLSKFKIWCKKKLEELSLNSSNRLKFVVSLRQRL